MLAADDTFERTCRTRWWRARGSASATAVEVTVREGPDAGPRADRAGRGVRRARPTASFDLTREGGHRARRIVHAGDMTGREVERALLAACDDAEHHASSRTPSRSTLIARAASVGLGGPSCASGAYVLDRADRRDRDVLGRATVLATGGAGKVYLYTTNPDVATGDGVAMAYRAGAAIANMEFYPVPSHLPLPPAGEELPHHRGAARRGRRSCGARRRGASWSATTRARSWRRATSWPAPSTPR